MRQDSELKTQREVIEALRVDMVNLTSQNTVEQRQLRERVLSLTAVEEKNTQLNSTVAELQATITQLQTQSHQAQLSIDSLTQQNNSLEQNVDRLTHENQQLSANQATMEQRLATTLQTLTEKNTTIQELQAENSTLTRNNEQIRSQMEQMNTRGTIIIKELSLIVSTFMTLNGMLQNSTQSGLDVSPMLQFVPNPSGYYPLQAAAYGGSPQQIPLTKQESNIRLKMSKLASLMEALNKDRAYIQYAKHHFKHAKSHQ